MKIRLECIRSDEPRTTSQLAQGEVVSQEVDISVDGRVRTVNVYVKARILPRFDGSLVYGDAVLEELLRFEPAVLSAVYRCVGKYRRGEPVSLPVVLLDSDRGGMSADLPPDSTSA